MNQNFATLDVRHLSHHFATRAARVEVLDEVSFTVNSGELVSIKGASGSGKTTLLLACGGMLSPSAGSVLIEDIDLYNLSSANRNRLRSRQIGYVFQTLQLLSYLNVLENVTLQSKANKHEAIEWLERFGLAERIKHRPAELSQGQRQRVAIIRAIVHQPKLLIADEPTGNLDENNSKLVFEILRHFADSGGAVLLASHDSEADHFSDRIFQLEDKLLKEVQAPKANSGSTDKAGSPSLTTDSNHSTSNSSTSKAV